MTDSKIITSITFKGQSKDLLTLEKTVFDAENSFFLEGQALCELTNKEHYVERGFSTFEQYVNIIFDMTRDYAYKRMGAYRVITILKDHGFKPSELPKTESQARPLTKLNGEQGELYQKEIIPTWRRVVDAKCRITAVLITKEVNKTLGKEEPKKDKDPKENRDDNTGTSKDKDDDTQESEKVFTKTEMDAQDYRISILKQKVATLESKLQAERNSKGASMPDSKIARDMIQAGFKAIVPTLSEDGKKEALSIKAAMLGL